MTAIHDGAFRLSVAKVNTNIYTLLGAGAIAFAFCAYLGNVWVGVVVAGVCAAVAWWWRRQTVRDRAVKLALNQNGIHAPDATEKPVPWNALQKIILSSTPEANRRSGGGMSGMIVMDIKGDPKRFGPKDGKYFGGSSIAVNVDDLDGMPQDIFRLIATYAPGLEVLEK